MAQSLADAAAQGFSAPLGTVLVKLQVIPPAYYAEDHGRPEGVHPFFLTVLESRILEGSALEGEISQLRNAIAAVLNCQEPNIYILYQANDAGRAASGGKLVGRKSVRIGQN